jgi:hypothetical protein
MTHMTEEEWRGCMSVATANTPTVYRQALIAWRGWNPEWLLDKVNAEGGDSSKAKFTIDEVMRAFMEAYILGVTKKITGGDHE